MAILAALHHRTSYRYARPVTLSPQVIRLRPAPHCRTPVPAYSLRIEPKPHFINWQQDPFGNWLARVVFPQKVAAFEVCVDLTAELAVYNPFDFFLEPSAEKAPFAYDPSLAHDLAPYLVPAAEGLGPRFKAYLAGIDRTPRPTVNFLVAINQRLQRDIGYVIRLEPGVQKPEETLTLRRGSCRDSAWLLVQLLRGLGLAARFVSGYLIQLAPDQKALDGPSGTSVDFTDLHAWTEVYLPGAGWIGLDPTSGLFAGEGHLPLAATPDFQTAAPVSGLVEPVETKFDFAMHVRRAAESPRVTKPYSEDAWRSVLELGDRVDARLREGDVRLTMGGEPTFVSIDDPDGPEWNAGAVGTRKRALSASLLERLAKAYGKGALRHHGMGKWYPGEQLPRWSDLACWRSDGVPLWKDPTLLATPGSGLGHGLAEAGRFARGLATRLGVGDRWLMEAHEDAWYHLWRERKLPVNVSPLDAKLDDPLERERLARVFRAGLDTPRGFVLPLQKRWSDAGRTWTSGSWFLREETLFLIPGDSPIGFRLPLDSIPWVAPEEAAFVEEMDPLAPRGPLPVAGEDLAAAKEEQDPAAPATRRGPRPQIARFAVPRVARGGLFAPRGQGTPADAAGQAGDETPAPPAVGVSAPQVVRTALCVEARDGLVHVFLPPLGTMEDFVELAAAIEATAAAESLPVVLEGYPPPYDPRVETLKVTPDPGVLEINIHPSGSWRELVERTETLYEEARQNRLGTEKFLVDGRHVGTGGGNHIVLGGATPADSPFLRRPELLASLLGFWQRHPSLSYVFSGLFIGPTSQAPRVDEARMDVLAELEIACAELRRAGSVPPWLVDRLFRNLLTDLSGNTHRAEFCIDKLYSPDGPAGRLGLLELRGFEMPPHARMSLVQQLLVRALVAWFWESPQVPTRFTRWGTALHDRFMLPHFAAEDLRAVCAELAAAGFPMDPAWFEPHLEFRFPRYGEIRREGVRLELRHALEPWHVLGEEGMVGGTVRYVDSSVERLQVRTSGLVPETHAVLVNGRRLPLHALDLPGEHVAGVRFRAWQPPNCLHPTLPPHVPLTIEIVELATGRSLGGCTYHAAHPGGRNYVTLPVNGYEAESRRLARFEPFGASPARRGPVPPAVTAPEHPVTLDLRRG